MLQHIIHDRIYGPNDGIYQLGIRYMYTNLIRGLHQRSRVGGALNDGNVGMGDSAVKVREFTSSSVLRNVISLRL